MEKTITMSLREYTEIVAQNIRLRSKVADINLNKENETNSKD